MLILPMYQHQGIMLTCLLDRSHCCCCNIRRRGLSLIWEHEVGVSFLGAWKAIASDGCGKGTIVLVEVDDTGTADERAAVMNRHV